MSEKKGIHWLVWVAGGCAALVLVVGIGVVGLGVFAAKKVTEVAEKATSNPVTTIAKAYALANRDVEFVRANEEAQTVVFRNVETGREATFDFSELQEGRIRFEDDQGEEIRIGASQEGLTVEGNGEERFRVGTDEGGGVAVSTADGTARFGAGGEVPAWVPRPEGASLEVVFSASSPDGETGAFQVRGDSVDAVAAQWKKLLMDAGFTIETEMSQAGLKMLVGRNGSKQVSMSATERNGAAEGVVNYTSQGG